MHQPARVLLVEDSVVNQTLTRRWLEKHGWLVDLATTGDEALAQIQSQLFDIVLMDVDMPGMNGLEATRQIRHLESESAEHLPIVGLTSVDRQTCLAAGMDDHLSKPADPELLLAMMQRIARPRPTGPWKKRSA